MKYIKKVTVLLSKRSRLSYKQKNSRSTGIIIGEDFKQKDNYRLLNLLVRSLLVISVAIGSIDGFMSAFNIEYNAESVFLFIIVFNILLTFLQLNLLLRIGGYAAIVWGALTYYGNNINLMRSGINAITNIMYELVRVKFKLPEVKGFSELIADRGVTISAVIIVFACFYLMMLWETCGRSMNIIFTAGISFAILSMGLYFGGTPSILSVVLLSAAWIIITCVKFNGKYRFSVKQKAQHRFLQWGENLYIIKLLNGKVLAQLAALMIVYAAAMTTVMNLVITPESYEASVPESELKNRTDVMAKDAMIIAFSKYKNLEVTGSVSRGQLGRYSSVSPDYKPDLEITYLPSSMEREYLKTYVGTDYSSSGWSTSNAPYSPEMTNKTAAAARASGQPFNKMRIKNLDIYTRTPFLPYYTDLDTVPNLMYLSDVSMEMTFPRGSEYEVIYYRAPDVEIDDSKYRDYIYGSYLNVPDANKDLIMQLCSEQGWSKDDPELTRKIARYFEDNFTYTLSPGLVPWKTDFVNYFLFESKEGLCAHFASAGALIYRCLGIPSRYVEGYALDYPLAADEQTVLENENAEDWYNGPSPLLQKPVTVTLSDFSAHGWVEIYKDGYGWVPVELTPWADDLEIGEKKTEPTITDQLIELFMSAGDQTADTQLRMEELKQNTVDLGGYVLLILICLAILVLAANATKLIVKHAVRLNIFSKKNSDSVVAIYSYIMDILVFKKKIDGTSHKDMASALAAYVRSPELIVSTIEEILYSPDKPTEKECENTFISLHSVLNKLLDESSFIEKIKILLRF